MDRGRIACATGAPPPERNAALAFIVAGFRGTPADATRPNPLEVLTAMPRRRLLFAGSPALLLSFVVGGAAAQEARAGDLAVQQPWARAAGQGATGAGFLSISNRGAAADRLLSASTPAARAVELHTMIRDGDVMRMRAVPGIEVPAGQTVALRPGGLHLMLVGLSKPLREGEAVPLTLRFERAGEVRVELSVQAAGAREPAAHRH